MVIKAEVQQQPVWHGLLSGAQAHERIPLVEFSSCFNIHLRRLNWQRLCTVMRKPSLHMQAALQA